MRKLDVASTFFLPVFHYHFFLEIFYCIRTGRHLHFHEHLGGVLHSVMDTAWEIYLHSGDHLSDEKKFLKNTQVALDTLLQLVCFKILSTRV